MVHWKVWDLARCEWYGIRGGYCPGFGWNGVNFLLSNRCRAVFWIQYESLVTNTLIFWLLLTLSQELPSFPFLLVSRCTRSQRKDVQAIWPELATGIFHSTECHAQHENIRSWLGAAGHCSGTGWASVIKGWEIVPCICCFFWGLFLSPSLSAFCVITIFFSVNELFLTQKLYWRWGEVN